MIGIGAGVGRLIGPATGAFLARPAVQFPEVFGNSAFFKTYPYSLPCLMAAFVCFLCLVLAYLFLEETMPTKKQHVIATTTAPAPKDTAHHSTTSDTSSSTTSKPRRRRMTSYREGDESGDEDQEADEHVPLLHSASGEAGTTTTTTTSFADGEHSARQASNTTNTSSSINSTSDKRDAYDAEAGLVGARGASEILQQQPRSLAVLAVDRAVGISTALYGLLAFITVIAQEVLPLYLLTSPKDGGLNLSLQDIGIVILYCAPVQISAQVFLFPLLSKRFGYANVYKSGLTLYSMLVLIVPELPRFSAARPEPGGGGADISLRSGRADMCSWLCEWIHSPLFAPGLLFAATQAAAVLSFTSTFVLINNSCPPFERGTANGLGQTYAALGRALGPAVGGALFAWSEASGRRWPFDYHFVWYVDAVVCACALALSTQLPRSVLTQTPAQPQPKTQVVSTSGAHNTPQQRSRRHAHSRGRSRHSSTSLSPATAPASNTTTPVPYKRHQH